METLIFTFSVMANVFLLMAYVKQSRRADRLQNRGDMMKRKWLDALDEQAKVAERLTELRNKHA